VVRRTRDEALETRNTILDTAERVFSERGVSHTSLADIAAAAGVTRGAIYWHFKNKADLFDAMMNRVVLPMEQMAARAGDAGIDDPLAYVRACALTNLSSPTIRMRFIRDDLRKGGASRRCRDSYGAEARCVTCRFETKPPLQIAIPRVPGRQRFPPFFARM